MDSNHQYPHAYGRARYRLRRSLVRPTVSPVGHVLSRCLCFAVFRVTVLVVTIRSLSELLGHRLVVTTFSPAISSVRLACDMMSHDYSTFFHTAFVPSRLMTFFRTMQPLGGITRIAVTMSPKLSTIRTCRVNLCPFHASLGGLPLTQ